jgi:3-oxoacyl-[acyl-carrier protein] reductase
MATFTLSLDKRALAIAGAAFGVGLAALVSAGAVISVAALVWNDKENRKAKLGAPAATSTGVPVDAVDPSAFRGKVVLITGSGGGLGGALGRRFATEGCKLALHYNTSRESCEKLKDDCLRLGAADVDVFKADLGDETGEQAKELFKSVVARFGDLHIVVNNAGKYEEQAAAISEDNYANFLGTLNNAYRNCLFGAAALTYLFGAHCAEKKKKMAAGGGAGTSDAAIGAVINIGSRGAFRGEPTAWAYGACKSAQHALGQSAAVRLAEHGVVVATLAPGFIGTSKKDPVLEGPRGPAIKGQSPWNRVAKEEEVAEAAVMMSRYWSIPWVTGGILDLNGASYLRG